jgi:hypothetical protein
MRTLRIALFACFVLSLPVAVTWRDADIGPYVRYAPPVFLALALAAWLIEWMRKRSAF